MPGQSASRRSTGGSTNGRSHASSTTGPRDPDARAPPATNAASGPEPGGSSRTQRQPAHARSDLDHGVAHLGQHACGTRRERLTAPDDGRLVGRHPAARAAGEQHARDRHDEPTVAVAGVSFSGRSE